MCAVCGCGEAKEAEGAAAHAHVHTRADGSTFTHVHDTPKGHGHAPAAVDYGASLAGVHIPGMNEARILQVERDILSKNDAYAAENRKFFEENHIFALNFVSSPGSGKTSLLVLAIQHLLGRLPIFVIEGDQQTSNDAERIRATGAPALQINTGKGCHLDAHMIAHAVETLGPVPGSALFIENVGNLVCPAAFDLGEAHKVVVFSVTEGEDKPLKYPDMFAAADLMLLNKSDLLPHLDFDVAACIANALRVNPRLQPLVVSARRGEGMAAFYAWIEASAARDERARTRS